MTEHAGCNTTVKVASILLLLANYMLTVNAAPLGMSEMMVSRFYWIFLIVILAVLSLIWYLSKSESPIEVIGLTYDKETHQLELTVKNSGSERYCIKSALRLMQPAADMINQATEDGNIPMAAAKASIADRSLFQLLGEDDSPVLLEPKETRTLAYNVLMPQEYLNLDSSKNVEVHISYGEDRGGAVPAEPAAQDDNALQIKMDSGEVIAEVFLLEDLLDALRNSPDESISYHMSEGNDFAEWVSKVVGDSELAVQLAAVEYSTPDVTKNNLITLLDSKLESLKHPYLRKVNPEESFILKSDHDQVLSEVCLLEELAESLANATADAVSFHMSRGNDFAGWVQAAVGDTELAGNIAAIEYTTAEETKARIVSAIRERVDYLRP
jgi:hypothetical protein